MAIIWNWAKPYPVTVKEVYEVAGEHRSLAYTSVLSTMTNLVKKGLLRVEKINSPIVYLGADLHSYRLAVFSTVGAGCIRAPGMAS